MLFSQIASFSLFFFSIGSAIASPTPNTAIVARQDTTDIESILTNLQGSSNSTLAQLSSLASTNNANDATVTPLITQLTTAIDAASASLAALPPSSRRSVKRDAVDDVAFIVAGIVRDISIVLDELLGHRGTILTLDVLLATVDVSLHQLLSDVELLLAGVLKVVQLKPRQLQVEGH